MRLKTGFKHSAFPAMPGGINKTKKGEHTMKKNLIGYKITLKTELYHEGKGYDPAFRENQEICYLREFDNRTDRSDWTMTFLRNPEFDTLDEIEAYIRSEYDNDDLQKMFGRLIDEEAVDYAPALRRIIQDDEDYRFTFIKIPVYFTVDEYDDEEIETAEDEEEICYAWESDVARAILEKLGEDEDGEVEEVEEF